MLVVNFQVQWGMHDLLGFGKNHQDYCYQRPNSLHNGTYQIRWFESFLSKNQGIVFWKKFLVIRSQFVEVFGWYLTAPSPLSLLDRFPLSAYVNGWEIIWLMTSLLRLVRCFCSFSFRVSSSTLSRTQYLEVSVCPLVSQSAQTIIGILPL